MKPEEFAMKLQNKSEEDYGLCPPPISGQDAFDVLRDHFLGEDWYTVLSMHQEQTNAEAVYDILRLYPKKKNLFLRFKEWINAL